MARKPPSTLREVPKDELETEPPTWVEAERTFLATFLHRPAVVETHFKTLHDDLFTDFRRPIFQAMRAAFDKGHLIPCETDGDQRASLRAVQIALREAGSSPEIDVELDNIFQDSPIRSRCDIELRELQAAFIRREATASVNTSLNELREGIGEPVDVAAKLREDLGVLLERTAADSGTGIKLLTAVDVFSDQAQPN